VIMKICARCKKEKDARQFSVSSTRKDGRNPYCLECSRLLGKEYYSRNKEKTKIRTQKWHKANPEKTRESLRRYRQKHIQYFRDYKRAEYVRNKDRVITILRDNKFRKKFGISLSERDRLAEVQDRKCAICGKHESEMTRRLAVDHDHVTRKIRGMLCNNCNLGLGHFKSDIDLLKKALNYIERTREEEGAYHATA